MVITTIRQDIKENKIKKLIQSQTDISTEFTQRYSTGKLKNKTPFIIT